MRTLLSSSRRQPSPVIPQNLALFELDNALEQLRQEYTWLTSIVLPQLATQRNFPVSQDHCFQRIILDNLFGHCWYEALDQSHGPAYLQLSEAQLREAIALAHSIVQLSDDYLHQLNQSSLNWRGQQP